MSFSGTFLVKFYLLLQILGMNSYLFMNFLTDPGSIEIFGCTKIPQKPQRYLAMGLFGVYLIATIIILVNLLIAMMNTTITNIHNQKV